MRILLALQQVKKKNLEESVNFFDFFLSKSLHLKLPMRGAQLSYSGQGGEFKCFFRLSLDGAGADLQVLDCEKEIQRGNISTLYPKNNINA